MNGGLYCASQASSPVLIRLGAHTGGSVCLGLQPLHVVAAPPHRTPFCCESHFQGVRLWTNGLPSPGPGSPLFVPAASFPRCRRPNGRSVFLVRLLERFAERREDAGPRGGRRQTEHQGRVQAEVVEVGVGWWWWGGGLVWWPAITFSDR